MQLLMPMGGRGVRFEKGGVRTPKPLIDLRGKPLFYWAAQSVLRVAKVSKLVFVVLREHVEDFDITGVIKSYYPNAEFVVLNEVLNGPVLSCEAGMAKIDDGANVLVNDCDHLFFGGAFATFCAGEAPRAQVDGALLTFFSNDPAYSYAVLDRDGRVTGTVEKKVVSAHAICGAYYFKNKGVFHSVLDSYRKNCPYDELFISGLFTELAAEGRDVRPIELAGHLSFGTPEEFALAQKPEFDAFFDEVLK